MNSKATITNIDYTSDHKDFTAGRYYYNERCEITAIGYKDNIEYTLIMKIPAKLNNVPDFGKSLNVSVSFDEHISTIKTTQLI